MAELLYINSSGTNVYGGYYTGQSFTTTGAWLVQSIWIDSVRTLTAGPFDVTCSIYLDAGGVPTGAALGVSDPVSCNNVLAAKTFTFSTPFSLNNATKYWAIIDCAGADATWFVRTDSSAYANGEVGYGSSGDLSDFAGDSSYDCKQFKVNGLEAPSSYASVKDGEWDDGDTWGYPASAGGFYPSVDGDDVTITHTVTYSISADVELGDITINSGGTLSFNPSADTYMEIQNNTFINVNDGALLTIGTSAAPIHRNYTAQLAFNCSTDNAGGIFADDSGSFQAYGDLNYFGMDKETFLAYGCTDTTSITATEDMSSKWNVGDEIIIGERAAYSNWQLQGALTTITGFNGNTIQCADSITSDIPSGGVIANLSRNVKVHKKDYIKALYNLNTGRPYIEWDNVESDKFLSGVEFGGIQRLQNMYMNLPIQGYGNGNIEWCTFRNGNIALYYNYGNVVSNCIFHSFNQTIHTGSSNQYNDLIFMNCGYGFYAGVNWSYAEDIYGINCGAVVQYPRGLEIKGLRSYGCYGEIGGGHEVIVRDSYICAVQTGVCSNTTDARYYNCSFGVDIDGSELPNNYNNQYGTATAKYYNCKIIPSTAGEHYRVNNIAYTTTYHLWENYNQVEGDHRIYGNFGYAIKVDADGGGSRPTQRTGGNQSLLEVVTWSNCIKSQEFFVFEPIRNQQIYTQAGVEKTIRYYIQTDYTNGFTSDAIYLDAYYDTTQVISTDTIATRSNQSDWSQYLEVTVSPTQDGWVRINLVVNDYESGKYIWIDPKPEIIF
jgi:hypothetical protein